MGRKRKLCYDIVGTEQRPAFHILGKKRIEAMTQEFDCGREVAHFIFLVCLMQLQLRELKRTLLGLAKTIADRRSDAVRRLLRGHRSCAFYGP